MTVKCDGSVYHIDVDVDVPDQKKTETTPLREKKRKKEKKNKEKNNNNSATPSSPTGSTLVGTHHLHQRRFRRIYLSTNPSPHDPQNLLLAQANRPMKTPGRIFSIIPSCQSD